MKLSSDSSAFADIASTTGRAPDFYRGYNPPSAGVPPHWPGSVAGAIPDGASGLISIRPHVESVLDGVLDEQLTAFFAQVPAGARVTCWHEGERGEFPYTGAQILGLHQRCYSLFSEAAPLDASYGQVLSTWTATKASKHYPLPQWVSPGLDFYGLDGYGIQAADSPESVFMPAIDQLLTGLGEGQSQIEMWESNHELPAMRPEWFRAAARLAADFRMPFVGTYWGTAPYKFHGSTALTEALAQIQGA